MKRWKCLGSRCMKKTEVWILKSPQGNNENLIGTEIYWGPQQHLLSFRSLHCLRDNSLECLISFLNNVSWTNNSVSFCSTLPSTYFAGFSKAVSNKSVKFGLTSEEHVGLWIVWLLCSQAFYPGLGSSIFPWCWQAVPVVSGHSFINRSWENNLKSVGKSLVIFPS